MNFQMKTGFNCLQSNEEQIPDDLKLKINAIMLTLIEKSIDIAVKYSKSSGRNNISSTDLLYALQFQAHEFLDEKDLVERCIANEDIINNSDSLFDNLSDSNDNLYDSSDNLSDSNDNLSDSNDNLSDSSDNSSDSSDSNDNEYFCRSDDNDPIIQKMNHYHDNWSDWEPQDQIRYLLKKSIDSQFQS